MVLSLSRWKYAIRYHWFPFFLSRARPMALIFTVIQSMKCFSWCWRKIYRWYQTVKEGPTGMSTERLFTTLNHTKTASSPILTCNSTNAFRFDGFWIGICKIWTLPLWMQSHHHGGTINFELRTGLASLSNWSRVGRWIVLMVLMFATASYILSQNLPFDLFLKANFCTVAYLN